MVATRVSCSYRVTFHFPFSPRFGCSFFSRKRLSVLLVTHITVTDCCFPVMGRVIIACDCLSLVFISAEKSGLL